MKKSILYGTFVLFMVGFSGCDLQSLIEGDSDTKTQQTVVANAPTAVLAKSYSEEIVEKGKIEVADKPTFVSQSSAVEGSIEKLEWSLVADGVTTPLQECENQTTCTLSNLEAKSYQLLLKVTDSQERSGSTKLEFEVLAQTTPVALLETNYSEEILQRKKITPEDEIAFVSKSSDEDGVVETLEWYLLDNTSTTKLDECKNKTECSVTNLKEGVYRILLKVTDNDANYATSKLEFEVKSAALILKATHLPIKKTRQIKSYDENGTEVTDNSIKDDGYYQKGLTPDYTRASDIVTDELTHLMWQDDEAVATVTKQWLTDENYDICEANTSSPACFDTSGDTAATYCSNFSLGGYEDWRLPTKEELESIVDYTHSKPTIDTDKFKNTGSDAAFWSSTTYEDGKNDAWNVLFRNGHIYYRNKNIRNYVRCIREGQ